MNKKQISQLQLLNDAALINQSKVINQLRQTPRGDREIVFDNAQLLARRGLDLTPLLMCLKATFKEQQVIHG